MHSYRHFNHTHLQLGMRSMWRDYANSFLLLSTANCKQRRTGAWQTIDAATVASGKDQDELKVLYEIPSELK